MHANFMTDWGWLRKHKHNSSMGFLYDMADELGVSPGNALKIVIREAQSEKAGMRRAILRMATKRFGAPDTASFAALETVDTYGELEDIIDRMFVVCSWSELLAK